VFLARGIALTTTGLEKSESLADGGLQAVLAARVVSTAVYGSREDEMQNLRVCMAEN
jgi:hypothetical protein